MKTNILVAGNELQSNVGLPELHNEGSAHATNVSIDLTALGLHGGTLIVFSSFCFTAKWTHKRRFLLGAELSAELSSVRQRNQVTKTSENTE